jgi:hypothetical protein
MRPFFILLLRDHKQFLLLLWCKGAQRAPRGTPHAAPTERHNTLALVQHMPPPRALPIVGASPSQLEYRVRQLAAEVERLTAELELARAVGIPRSNEWISDAASVSLSGGRQQWPLTSV